MTNNNGQGFGSALNIKRMTNKEAIDRWAESIIPAVFKAEDALKKAKPEWTERLAKLGQSGGEDQHKVAEEYCREIATIIVRSGSDYDSTDMSDREPDNKVNDPILDRPMTDFALSVRALCCTKAAGIVTVRDLVRHTKMDLLKYRNFGKKSLTELDDFLTGIGLMWGMNV